MKHSVLPNAMRKDMEKYPGIRTYCHICREAWFNYNL